MIRTATGRDVEAIAAIYGHHVQHGTASFETVPPDVEEMMRRYRSLHDQGYPYLVMEADGAVVGYAYAGPTARASLISARWKTRSMSVLIGSAAALVQGYWRP
jgi:L-amino acid N-acyltransferase YncA